MSDQQKQALRLIANQVQVLLEFRRRSGQATPASAKSA